MTRSEATATFEKNVADIEADPIERGECTPAEAMKKSAVLAKERMKSTYVDRQKRLSVLSVIPGGQQ